MHIMYKPDGKPDTLWLAFQNYISDCPDGWDGQKIWDYIESDNYGDSMVNDKMVSIWQPFEDFDKEIFLESVEALKWQFDKLYSEGQNNKTKAKRNKLTTPPPTK